MKKELRQILNKNGEAAQETFLKFGWKTGCNYKADNSFIAKSKELPRKLFENRSFEKNIIYAESLYINSKNEITDNLFPESFKDEQKRWLHNGLCMYVSIVLYHLMLRDKVFNRGTLQYVQGYVLHEDPNTKEKHMTIHSWLSHKESVIDFTIYQLRYYGFVFSGEPFILGDIPKGITMVGYLENKETIKYLTSKFAKEQCMSMDEWIQFHYQNAELLYEKVNMS